MKLDSIGDTIGTRQLALGGKQLTVKIGKPRLFPDQLDYFCPYSIEFEGRNTIRYAGGIDAIQALQLFMGMIGADLSALARRRGSEIAWLGDAPVKLDFLESSSDLSTARACSDTGPRRAVRDRLREPYENLGD